MSWLFLVLVPCAVFPPFVGIVGPLSLDDVLPLLAVLVAAKFVVKRQPEPDPTWIGFALLALLGVVSASVNASSLSEWARLAGRSSGRAAFYLALIVGTRAALYDGVWARRGLVALAAAATVEASFCVFAYAFDFRGPLGFGLSDVPDWSVLKGHARVQGTFGGELNAFESASVSANFLAGYLVIAIPPTVALLAIASSWTRRALVVGSSALMTAALYLTYTRAALGAVAVAVLLLGYLTGRRRAAISAVVLGVTLALALPTMRAKVLGEGHDRFALWSAAVAVTAQHPFAGVGDGNYLTTLDREPGLAHTEYGVARTTAHNSILLSAAHHGVLGGVAALLLDVMAVLVGFLAYRRAQGGSRVLIAGLLCGFVGFLIQDQSNDLSHVPKVATQAWFAWALISSMSRHRAERAQEARSVTIAS
ncbi:MAG: O-antigen ligase family protein [Deltaproteobacteria bacterium]|nr:O-antigen ligase family protein [Deltaproteobacteria bacterium]